MKLRELRVVWAAILGGTVLYTLLAFGLVASGTVDMGGLDAISMNVAGAVVLLYMAGTVVVRRRMIGQIDPDDPAELRRSAYATAVIVGVALTEGGGLILITLGLVTGAATWILAGGLGAAFIILLAKPTGEEVGLSE